MNVSKFVVLLIGGCALPLAACGTSSTSPTGTAQPVSSATTTPVATTPTPTATATPMASSTPTASAVATSIDPCQLVTSSEASSLTGATYGAVVESTTQGGGNICTYGSATLNVFQVLVGEASSASAADAEWAQEQAQVQSELNENLGSGNSINITINDVSNVSGASMAAVGTGSATISGETLGVSAIYVLQGPTFFALSDLEVGSTPVSASALESQAETCLGRL